LTFETIDLTFGIYLNLFISSKLSYFLSTDCAGRNLAGLVRKQMNCYYLC